MRDGRWHFCQRGLGFCSSFQKWHPVTLLVGFKQKLQEGVWRRETPQRHVEQHWHWSSTARPGQNWRQDPCDPQNHCDIRIGTALGIRQGKYSGQSTWDRSWQSTNVLNGPAQRQEADYNPNCRALEPRATFEGLLSCLSAFTSHWDYSYL